MEVKWFYTIWPKVFVIECMTCLAENIHTRSNNKHCNIYGIIQCCWSPITTYTGTQVSLNCVHWVGDIQEPQSCISSNVLYLVSSILSTMTQFINHILRNFNYVCQRSTKIGVMCFSHSIINIIVALIRDMALDFEFQKGEGGRLDGIWKKSLFGNLLENTFEQRLLFWDLLNQIVLSTMHILSIEIMFVWNKNKFNDRAYTAKKVI